MIRFLCPGCGATYTVDDSKGGKTGKCPKCQSQFTIPMPETAAAPPAPQPAPPPDPAPAPANSNEPVEIAPCPGCQARLSVSPSDVGIDVECPYCKTVYKAVKPGTGTSGPLPPPAPPRVSQLERAGGRDRRDEDDERPSRRRRRDEDDELDERPSRRRRDEDEERPSRRRRRDEDEDDEDYEEPPRRKRRGGRTANSAAAVNVPAIFLIIIGGLGVLMGVANIVSVATGMNFAPAAQAGAANQAGQYIGALVSLIWAVVVLLGGIKMKSLTNRGSAMMGAIVAMIPCNPCCLLGLPIGIWALTVLNREDVKRAFD